MKTVITSKGNELHSNFDLRFGRGAFFCIYNEESKEVEFHKNEHADAQGGAGTKAAEKIIELGVSKVISGDFGPKAKELLDQFKIQMIILEDDDKRIEDIIKLLSNH